MLLDIIVLNSDDIIVSILVAFAGVEEEETDQSQNCGFCKLNKRNSYLKHKKNMYYLTDLTSKFSENSLKSQQFIF